MIFTRLARGGHVAQALGYAASLLVLAIMALMVVDITTRYITGSAVPGVYELVELSIAAAVFLGLPNTQRQEGMIRVDLVSDRLRPSTRRGVDVFASGFSLAVCLLLTVATFQSFLSALDSGEARTGLLTVPTWPTRLAITVGLAVLCLELAISLADGMRALRAGEDRHGEEEPAPPVPPV